MICQTLKNKFTEFVVPRATEQTATEQSELTFETFGIDNDIWKITYGTPTDYIKVTDRGYTTEVLDGKLRVGTDLTTADNARIKTEMLQALGKTKTAVPKNFEFLYDFMELDPALQRILSIS